MKTLIKTAAVTVLIGAFCLAGTGTAGAVEEHHTPASPEKIQPQESVPAQPGPAFEAAPSPAPAPAQPHAGHGMTAGSGVGGEHGMCPMMGRTDQGSGQNMMSMMDQPMMRMMMSHMMGGASGMGKMMGRMGTGMMDRVEGTGDMAQMYGRLDGLNLTPEQWEQVRTLAENRLETMIDLWAKRMKLRLKLSGLKWETEADPQHVKTLFMNEAEVRAEIFLTEMDYLKGLKHILTPEQFRKFGAPATSGGHH